MQQLMLTNNLVQINITSTQKTNLNLAGLHNYTFCINDKKKLILSVSSQFNICGIVKICLPLSYYLFFISIKVTCTYMYK